MVEMVPKPEPVAQANSAAKRKANTVNMLVPASVPPMSLTSGGWVQILLIAEVLLLLGWMAAGIVYGLKQSNPKKKEQSA